jgi:hypothetical protein
MKKVILLCALALTTIAFAQVPKKDASLTAAPAAAKTAQQTQQTLKPAPDVKWSDTTHDFGDITQGSPVTHRFTFTNSTKDMVIITNVKPSCGCTAANFTKTPIKPGETAFVEAKYDANAVGQFTKTVNVQFGDDMQQKTLTIRGKVEAKAVN